MIQGLFDNCDAPAESEALEAFFTGGYRRVVLEDVGHFPHREARVWLRIRLWIIFRKAFSSKQ